MKRHILSLRGHITALFTVSSIFILLLGGAIFWATGTAVHATNSIEFCISCHEMEKNNYAEYKDTIHAKNRTGVKAVCSDCHVPHDAIGLTVRKILAARDVYVHFTGGIETREKFEEHRLEMAKRVWLHMKQTDSAECRYCHDVHAMDSELQGATARKQHTKIGVNGKTCIDCHYGIAHDEPPGDLTPQDIMDEHSKS